MNKSGELHLLDEKGLVLNPLYNGRVKNKESMPSDQNNANNAYYCTRVLTNNNKNNTYYVVPFYEFQR